MAWDQLWINKPHLAYAVIGGFTTVFSLVSLFVKEKLYIGEATVATIFGVIVGPHCLNWFSPTTWGNTDNITLEISRIVLVVQIFAVAVELPKKYMLKHWVSVVLLLFPVMTFGWLISSVFIWKLVPSVTWLESLVLAACVTATDPVLASAVVGKGKFAKRVPGHLRNLLSAESGCNDGMAFPFAYLALACIQHAGHPNTIAFHFIVITCLYECVFGTVLGAIIGYTGRHAIKFAEAKNLIDRESFLVFYFVLALFCTGVGSIIGVDDLLVAFAAGAAFSWDGWFSRKTEESHVSNVIDLLLNMAFFVYFGAIVPWDLFNEASLGLSPWKLVIIAILIILFRRIPIMLALKPLIPDIRNWREALFCGHFGPIGVGAVFISILARAELEHDEPTPLAELPSPDHPHYNVVSTIWPVTTFLIIASILVHGSSIAVFTLGKRLNNLTITMTYTSNGEHSQSWLSRLPRMDSTRTSFSKHDRTAQTDMSDDEAVRPTTSTKVKPGVGMHRRKRSSYKQTEARLPPQNIPIDLNADRRAEREREEAGEVTPEENDIQAYKEGSNIVLEDSDGEVLDCIDSMPDDQPLKVTVDADKANIQKKDRPREGRKVVAYRLDDDIIVENLDGEVIRRYRIASGGDELVPTSAPPARRGSVIDRTLGWAGFNRHRASSAAGPSDVEKQENAGTDLVSMPAQHLDNRDEHIDDDRMKMYLSRLLNDKAGIPNAKRAPEARNNLSPEVSPTSKPKPVRKPSPPPPRIDPTDEEDNDGAESHQSADGDYDDEDETEFEKQRRLAALGVINDEDDATFLARRREILREAEKRRAAERHEG